MKKLILALLFFIPCLLQGQILMGNNYKPTVTDTWKMGGYYPGGLFRLDSIYAKYGNYSTINGMTPRSGLSLDTLQFQNRLFGRITRPALWDSLNAASTDTNTFTKTLRISLPSSGNVLVFPYSAIFHGAGGGNTRFANNYWLDGGGNAVTRIAGRVQGLILQNPNGRLSFITSQYTAAGVSPNLNYVAIDSMGRMMIGANSDASAKLHVLSTTEQARFAFDASNYLSETILSTGATAFDIFSSNGTPTFSFNKSVGINGVSVDSALTAPGIHSTQGLLVNGNANISLSVTVGTLIATNTSPALFVENNTSTLQNVKILSNDLTANSITGLNFLFYQDDGTARNSGYIIFGKEQLWTSTASTRDSYLAFATSLDGASTEKMRLTSSGNLSLGTTATDAKLNVQSTTEQARFEYDASNYLSLDVFSTGRTRLWTHPTNSAASYLEIAAYTLLGGPNMSEGMLYSSVSQNLKILSGSTGGAGLTLGTGSPGATTPYLTMDGSTGNFSFANASTVSSATFASGWTGLGWKIENPSSISTLTVDNVIVRNNLTAYSAQINKVNYVNGALAISVANGTSLSVSGTTITFDEDNGNKQIQFAIGDYIRAQIWTGRGTASYVGHVTAVNHSNTYGSANIVATTISGTPWNVMELVQVGSSADPDRQSVIYITAADANNPYIDMLAGVNDGVFAGRQKLRIGNLTGITDATFGGALSGYGLYADNVYLKGKLVVTGGNVADTTGLAAHINNNTTTINGGKITAGSITATQIAANTITTSQINFTIPTQTSQLTNNSGFITGIAYGDISGTKPPANADVTLSAINGGLSLTGGGLTLTSGGAAIKGGQTAYNTGAGFWIGDVSGTTKFSIGNPSGSYFTWDGSALTIKGSITITNTIPAGSVSGLAAVATSGTLAAGSVSGLATVATSGSYSNLSNTPNTTYIDGSGIYTGTLTATQVNAVAISASSITTGTLSGITFNAGTDMDYKIMLGSDGTGGKLSFYYFGAEAGHMARYFSGSNPGIELISTAPFKVNSNAWVTGNLILGSSAYDAAGAIKYVSSHFYGYNGSSWLQLDN